MQVSGGKALTLSFRALTLAPRRMSSVMALSAPWYAAQWMAVFPIYDEGNTNGLITKHQNDLDRTWEARLSDVALAPKGHM